MPRFPREATCLLSLEIVSAPRCVWLPKTKTHFSQTRINTTSIKWRGEKNAFTRFDFDGKDKDKTQRLKLSRYFQRSQSVVLCPSFVWDVCTLVWRRRKQFRETFIFHSPKRKKKKKNKTTLTTCPCDQSRHCLLLSTSGSPVGFNMCKQRGCEPISLLLAVTKTGSNFCP